MAAGIRTIGVDQRLHMLGITDTGISVFNLRTQLELAVLAIPNANPIEAFIQLVKR